MKRQTVLIIIMTALFCCLLAGYIIFIRPVEKEQNAPAETTVPDTEEGEELGLSNRYFLFTSLERSDIESIEVSNKDGGYTFVSDESGAFHLKGHEELQIDPEKFASLVSVSTYALAKTKVGSNLSDEKLAEYGLLTPQAWWIVTDKDGNRFRVLVGDRLLTGGGYYCMFDGRKSVYVLGTEVGDTVLGTPEYYVNHVICAGISQNDYFTVDNFTVFRDGNPLCRIRLVPKDQQVNKEAMAENIMDYPTMYYPNSSLYYEIVYQFMSLNADECVKVGASDEDLKKYGLSDPAHVILFEYHDISYRIYFSALTDGKYYVFSNLYPDVIGYVDAEDFYYLEYDLIKWIDPYVFQQYINDIDTIDISSGDVEAHFSIAHTPIENAQSELSEKISVTANGTALSEKASENFRQFYKNLLAVSIRDYCVNDKYCTLTDKELKALADDHDAAYLTFTYKKLTGETETYRFYRYSTRHSLVTVNGVGEFFVLTDLVDQIRGDTVKILSGDEVVAYSKN